MNGFLEGRTVRHSEAINDVPRTYPGALFVVGEEADLFGERIQTAAQLLSGMDTLVVPVQKASRLYDSLTMYRHASADPVAVVAINPTRLGLVSISGALSTIGYEGALIELSDDTSSPNDGVSRLSRLPFSEVKKQLADIETVRGLAVVELLPKLDVLLHAQATVVLPGYPDQAIRRIRAYQNQQSVMIYHAPGDRWGKKAQQFIEETAPYWKLPTVGVSTPDDLVAIVRTCVASSRQIAVVADGDVSQTADILRQEINEAADILFALSHSENEQSGEPTYGVLASHIANNPKTLVEAIANA